MKVVALDCPNCGSTLDVAENVEVIRCEHCGSRCVVREKESSRELELLKEELQDLKQSFDSRVNSHLEEIQAWEKRKGELVADLGLQRLVLVSCPALMVFVASFATAFLVGTLVTLFISPGWVAAVFWLASTVVTAALWIPYSLLKMARRQVAVAAENLEAHLRKKPGQEIIPPESPVSS